MVMPNLGRPIDSRVLLIKLESAAMVRQSPCICTPHPLPFPPFSVSQKTNKINTWKSIETNITHTCTTQLSSSCAPIGFAFCVYLSSMPGSWPVCAGPQMFRPWCPDHCSGAPSCSHTTRDSRMCEVLGLRSWSGYTGIYPGWFF